MQLATSFDGFCIYRPAEYNPEWATGASWYHVDQAGNVKPNKICVQGLVNYYDSGETDGGLVVVPGSQKVFQAIFRNRPTWGRDGDFVSIPKLDDDDDDDEESPWNKEIKEAGLAPVKLCFKAGDMVVWDSRTIHCNAPATALRPLPQDGSVLPPRRLVAYVCMTPASRLTKEAKELRRKAYFEGFSTTHWPEEVRYSGGLTSSVAKYWKPPALPPSLRKLIPLDESVPTTLTPRP